MTEGEGSRSGGRWRPPAAAAGAAGLRWTRRRWHSSTHRSQINRPAGQDRGRGQPLGREVEAAGRGRRRRRLALDEDAVAQLDALAADEHAGRAGDELDLPPRLGAERAALVVAAAFALLHRYVLVF